MNNLYIESRIEASETIQDRADEAINYLEEIIKTNIRNDIKTCVVIPARRGDVSAIFYTKFTGKVKTMTSRYRTIKIIDIHEKLTYNEFINKKLKSDMVHFTLDTKK